MIFLQAFGLTRFAESQQTWRSSALCAYRRTSTRFPHAKVKVSGIWDNCHCPAWRLLIDVCARACCMFATRAFIHASLHAIENRQGANGRSRELTLATRVHADARNRCDRMALVKVHGESYYGAHRLPAGRTAAGKRGRGRPAGQAAKLFEDRLLQVSKASAPFVMTFKF